MKKISKVLICSLLAVSLLGLTACSQSSNNTDVKSSESTKSTQILSVGSTALLPMTKKAADDFKNINANINISASGGGSVEGAQSVVKGTAQIGACDWDASKEVPGFKAFEGVVAHKVAVIPFATIVNEENPVKNLTAEQLKNIFTGQILNWKEVGGEDEPIIVINRAFGSGTRVNYQLSALNNTNIEKGNNENYKEVKSSGEMATSVVSNKNAIGFVDLVYVNKKPGLKAVAYNGVEANTENIINGTYPVYAYGYYLTKGEPTGDVKEFIEYIQSSEFQENNLKEMDFIPITAINK